MSRQMYHPTHLRSSSTEPQVALCKHGELNINSVLCAKTGLSWNYCHLYYDPDIKEIAIKLLTEQEIHSIRLSHTSKTSLRIAARRFCEHFKIPLGQRLAMPANYDQAKHLITCRLG